MMASPLDFKRDEAVALRSHIANEKVLLEKTIEEMLTRKELIVRMEIRLEQLEN